MEPIARLFLCARCQCQVLICPRCDRGNRYCGVRCAKAARRAATRAAGQRYQASRRGRFIHAARQQRYRARRQEVTHQGSAVIAEGALLQPSEPALPVPQPVAPIAPDADRAHCHFCDGRCQQLVRLDYLHRRCEPTSLSEHDVGRAARRRRRPGRWPPSRSPPAET